ncbi:MAG: hypothetical protein BGO31_02605 [Bacteroidetes bacterium 43-16]|nr:MAG: hypothetical protein BGO31_02605 [Bacteroidetes bacterium 43-16]
MIFLQRNIPIRALLYVLASTFFFASCTTGKKAATPPPVVVINPADSIELYSCGFENSSFSGKLPCFGDECGSYGAPVTTLQFKPQHKMTKVLEPEQGQTSNRAGTWTINQDCIIEINYEDGSREYFRFYKAIHKIERLNANRESFPGTLNQHNYLSKTR